MVGSVENIKNFTEVFQNLNDSEKIIVAVLSESKSKIGLSSKTLFDYLENDKETKQKFPDIFLELIENTLNKTGVNSSEIENQVCFMLSEHQKKIWLDQF